MARVLMRVIDLESILCQLTRLQLRQPLPLRPPQANHLIRIVVQ